MDDLLPILCDEKDERFEGVVLLAISDCGTEKTTAEVDKTFGVMIRDWEVHQGHWFNRSGYSMPIDHIKKLHSLIGDL